MASVSVALVGGGIFAKEQHIPAIAAASNLSLKAIFSRSLKSAEETRALVSGQDSSPDLYSADSGPGKTYKDLLARDDVKAVIVVLPIMQQAEYIEAALAAGKHVLAEKPIGPTVEAAKLLISTYQRIARETKATLAIAENFRYLEKYDYARDEIRKLGKVTGFCVRVFYTVKPDNKYLGTDWRKQPSHPGGFVLDAGVHFTAATRLLLGADPVDSVIGYTSLAQDYLAPLDTVNAVAKTKSGATGAILISVGQTLSAFEWDVACERGRVVVQGNKVSVHLVGEGGTETTEKEFEQTSGVSEEVAAWSDGLAQGQPDPRQSPEEALADLELLEAMLESNGEARKLQSQ